MEDMDDVMIRIGQHCQMIDDMVVRGKPIGRLGKVDPNKGGKAIHSIQKGKGKDHTETKVREAIKGTMLADQSLTNSRPEPLSSRNPSTSCSRR